MTAHDIGVFFFGWGVGALCWYAVLEAHRSYVCRHFAPFVSIAAVTTFAPTTHIRIDSRADRAAIQQEILDIVSKNNRKMLLMFQDRVSRGYLVGSKGPERFIPGSEGKIGGI